MKWYSISKEYIDYLKIFDNRVPNVDYGINHIKPFIGTIFHSLDGIDYFCPISSYKPKFTIMPDKIHFIKLIDPDNDRIISALCLNYMIPVPRTEAHEITYKGLSQLRHFKTDTEKRMYWRFLNKEKTVIEEKKDLILANAEKLYYICKTSTDFPLKHQCLDFPNLEEKCILFEINKSKKMYPSEEMNKKIADKYLASIGKCFYEYNHKLYIVDKQHKELGLADIDFYYGESFLDQEYAHYAHYLYATYERIENSYNLEKDSFCLNKQELFYLNISSNDKENDISEKNIDDLEYEF